MTFDIRRNPRVLAGEILEKIGAVDWTPLAGAMRSTAHKVLTNWSAIKGALEQIKQGKIPAMNVRLEQLQSRGKDSSRERYASVFKSPSFDGLRNKKLLETTADDFFAVFKQGKVAITYFLKRLHNFALSLGWIALPVVAPYLWPKYEAKERRGITPDEQQSILAIEKKAEWKLFLELLWGKRPIRYGS